jgi:putative restriction endonuclease
MDCYPNHDALFDKRYISFDETGKVMIKDSLDETTKILLNINETMRIKMNERQQNYMNWHREKFLNN